MSANPSQPGMPPDMERKRDSDEQRKRASNRLAFTILGVSAGCGCLFFIGAFVFGMVLGAIDAGRRLPPQPPEEDPVELRLSK